MNSQELNLMLKGVGLAKEGPQFIGISSSSADSHKLQAFLDHLLSHVKDKVEYHSMLLRDSRLPKSKDRKYYSNLIDSPDEEFQQYLEYFETIAKESQKVLVFSGFEYLLRFCNPSRILNLFTVIKKLQPTNFSKQYIYIRIYIFLL